MYKPIIWWSLRPVPIRNLTVSYLECDINLSIFFHISDWRNVSGITYGARICNDTAGLLTTSGGLCLSKLMIPSTMGIVTIPTAGFISDEDEDVNEGLVEVGLVECAVTQMDYKKSILDAKRKANANWTEVVPLKHPFLWIPCGHTTYVSTLMKEASSSTRDDIMLVQWPRIKS